MENPGERPVRACQRNAMTACNGGMAEGGRCETTAMLPPSKIPDPDICSCRRQCERSTSCVTESGFTATTHAPSNRPRIEQFRYSRKYAPPDWRSASTDGTDRTTGSNGTSCDSGITWPPDGVP